MQDDTEMVLHHMEYARSDLEQRLFRIHSDRIYRYRKTVMRRISRAMKVQPESENLWRVQLAEWHEQFMFEMDALLNTSDRTDRLALRRMLVDDRLRLNDDYISLRRYVRSERVDAAAAVIDHQVLQHDHFIGQIALLLDSADFYAEDVRGKLEGNLTSATEFAEAGIQFMQIAGVDLRYA